MTEEVPLWLRVFDVLVGIILAALGIWVILGIVNPMMLVGIAIMRILGVILIIWGVWRFIKAFLAKEMVTTSRTLLLIAAMLLVIFGGLAFAHPLLLESLIAFLFAVGLIVFGVITFIVAFVEKDEKDWVRGLRMGLGFFLLILGIIFVFYLQTAAQILYVFLAIALIIIGFVRLVFGLSGDYY
ncbi:MAG: DUF308 domain-containing protein [Candidatus Hodarchaeota archaeon]